MQTRPLVALAATAVCISLACGGGGGGDSGSPATPTAPTSPTTPTTPATPSTPAAPTAVIVENDAFNPSTTTVPVGSTVKWTWDTCTNMTDPYGYGTQTCVDHSVTWDAGGSASPTQSQGTYQRTFDVAGTYTYHCAVHGAAMTGKVVVQ